MDVIFPECVYLRMADLELTPLQKNVAKRLEDQKLNALQAATNAGLGKSFVRDILRGKTRSPSAENLRKLADALGTTPEQLLSHDPANELSVRRIASKVEGIPVRGKVSAATWYTVDEFNDLTLDDDSERVPSVSGYPVEWQFGMIVDGNCLNKIAQDGDRLVCLDLISSQTDIQDGDLVIVERTRFNGQMRQRTAKRVKRTKAGFELWPESTDPAHQEPIRLDDLAEGEDVVVMAKVLWVLRKP